MAARGKLQSIGRLLDPLVDAVWLGGGGGGGGGASPFAALNAWRHRRRAQTANSEALQRVLDADRGFQRDAFLAAAKAGYLAVLAAVSSGRLADAKPLVTEHALAAIRRGADEAIAETGARQGATVVEFLEHPSLVHARVAWTMGELGRAPGQKPDVAQLTTRFVTLQRARAQAVSASEAREPAALHADPSAALGEWAPVWDRAGSGHVYYANAATGAATWSKPAAAKFVARAPFRVDAAGSERSLVVREGEELPLVRVVHTVVWERLLQPGAPAVWRVARL
jgi:hypothetical protein